MTFFRNRVRPSTPPSFVNDAASASGVAIGAGVSMPTSDHVPLEM